MKNDPLRDHFVKNTQRGKELPPFSNYLNDCFILEHEDGTEVLYVWDGSKWLDSRNPPTYMIQVDNYPTVTTTALLVALRVANAHAVKAKELGVTEVSDILKGGISIEQVIGLAMSDGEYLGRHGSQMSPSEVLAIREKATMLRIQQANEIIQNAVEPERDE